MAPIDQAELALRRLKLANGAAALDLLIKGIRAAIGNCARLRPAKERESRGIAD